jgi:hypothetical protein
MLRWLNDFTLGLAEEHAQVVPTFTLFPEPDVTAEVARCLAAGGQVVKVHLQVGRFHATEPLLDEAWGLLAAARTPIVVHASAVYGVDGGEAYCGADGLRALLDRHPGLRLVVAHLGMPTYDEFLDLAEEHPELRMDTAMVLTDPAYGEDARRAEDRIDRLRGIADRLLFGSDFPTIPHRYAAQVRGLATLGLDDASLRWLLHDHAAGLLAGVRPARRRRRRTYASSSSGSSGGESRNPCARSTSSRRRSASCASVSTPSATVSIPRLRARPATAAGTTPSPSPLSPVTPAMNDPSIFSASIGNSSRWVSDE